MGTDSEIVYNSQTFSSDSALDQSGRAPASESTPHSTSTSPAGLSDNPVRVESSPENNTEVPPVEPPNISEPRPRRNPGPPNLYGDRRFILQVSSAATTEIVDSDEEPLINFSGSKSLQTTFSSDSPSDYLTQLENLLPQPKLVADTKQGSTSTPSSITPKIAVLSSPLVQGGLDIQDNEGSDIISVIEIEVRKEADSFHDTFNATI